MSQYMKVNIRIRNQKKTDKNTSVRQREISLLEKNLCTRWSIHQNNAFLYNYYHFYIFFDVCIDCRAIPQLNGFVSYKSNKRNKLVQGSLLWKGHLFDPHILYICECYLHLVLFYFIFIDTYSFRIEPWHLLSNKVNFDLMWTPCPWLNLDRPFFHINQKLVLSCMLLLCFIYV